MARVPLTEKQVKAAPLILNAENVGLTPEQFFRLCGDNPDLSLELTAQKEIVIMSPAGIKTDWRNTKITQRLSNWAERDGTGLALGPQAGYTLPNGAVRAPDASWLPLSRWNALSEEEQERFANIYPDFAVELMSPSNTLPELQAKMDEYIANGVRLGWLINPYQKRVYVYRPGQPVECLDNPSTITGDPVLPGFVFSPSEIW